MTKSGFMLQRNISLKNYNTFGLDYKADEFFVLKSEEEAIKIIKRQARNEKPSLVLGGGSNLLLTSDFHGRIMHIEIGGIKIEEQNSDKFLVSAGGGVIWDSFVEWAVSNGLGGIENLSLIPGTVGAAPVQNIGAYGVEVKNTIEKVRAISLKNGTIREFSNTECLFGYRNSIFKNKVKGEYIVSRVYFRLSSEPLFVLSYGSLEKEAARLGKLTLGNVREAVINIRRSKLPDPQVIGNAGSFFKNPVVDASVSEGLKSLYPDMPVHKELSGEIKLSAGWMIEQCGWKGRRMGDAGVHDRQALVLVNHGQATGKDLFTLSEEIRDSVRQKFRIELEREVEVI